MELPGWWSWEIEISGHLLKRMADRGFNETDLRIMLADALDLHEEREGGRWVIETRHHNREWEVIVEPVEVEEVLVIVTAYPLDQQV